MPCSTSGPTRASHLPTTIAAACGSMAFLTPKRCRPIRRHGSSGCAGSMIGCGCCQTAAHRKSRGGERCAGVDFLLVNDRVAGEGDQRLGLFALAPRQQLEEAGLGTVFGDPAAPPPVTEANGWFRLDGYAVTAEARPGEAVLLTLLWQDLAAVDENYQVFVHLLDEQGNKIEQADGQPVQWLRPTSTWQPGEKNRRPLWPAAARDAAERRV